MRKTTIAVFSLGPFPASSVNVRKHKKAAHATTALEREVTTSRART
jgi:hypothetical protein